MSAGGVYVELFNVGTDRYSLLTISSDFKVGKVKLTDLETCLRVRELQVGGSRQERVE